MRKKVLQVLKISAGLLVVLLLVMTVALFWPMPEISVPGKHERLLIKSVNIVNVKTGEILKDRNVWIEGNRINLVGSTGSVKVDSTTFVINGDNKYLIPGLWDMHTHSTQHSPWLHHPLYIANGVTGVRDMSGQLGKDDSYWAGTRDRRKWNQKLADHKQVTPRYVLQSSYQINGDNSVPDGFPEYFRVQTEEDIDSLLTYYKNEGTDFIKVYADIPAVAYRELVKESQKYDMHVAGHKPLNIPLEEAITSGQRSFEHARIFMFDSFPYADSLLRADDKRSTFRSLMPSMISEFDTVKAVRLMELMHKHNSYWTPTLQTVKMSAFADDEQYVNTPYLDYILTMREVIFWNPDIGRSAEENHSTQREGINKDFYDAVKGQVGMAHQKGVQIMAGTDVTDTHVFPGFSLHTELEDLTKAGLSNLEALQAATLIPAQFSSLESELGSVEHGKLADLILLHENPLDDIAHTRKISSVILNGIYYDREALDNLKENAKTLASSFHMNVKFVYSLFASPLMRKQFAD